MPLYKRQKILGVVFNKSPSIDRKSLSAIRSGIHKLETGRVKRSDIQNYVQSLQGKIANLKRINPEKGRKLALDLLSALRQIPESGIGGNSTR
jgi:hypothetical protein